jgi:hypothetical protein
MSDPEATALDAVFRRSDRIVGRRIADEFILVPIVGHGAEVDSIYNLNVVGAFIWQQMDGRRSGRAIVEALVARYDVEYAAAEADYQAFVKALLSIGALTPPSPA